MLHKYAAFAIKQRRRDDWDKRRPATNFTGHKQFLNSINFRLAASTRERWDRGTDMLEPIKRLLRDQRGATAIEYGLIVSLIVVGIMVALVSLGSNVGDMWDYVADEIIT